MRHLLQPAVLKWAVIAAAASAVASYPRLSFWQDRPVPVWYLEAIIFLCSIVLWGFVFAWHAQYTNRPVFILHLELGPFIAITLIGLILAMTYHLFLDSSLRELVPEEYPAHFDQWFALLLFSMAFNQLFLLFAPFAWLMRLTRNRWVAASLTALFGACLLAIKILELHTHISPQFWAALLAARIVMGLLAVFFYLRGGVLFIWWLTFLFQARLLPDLAGNF